MQEVYNFINQLNLNNKYVVCAVSGGPDSMLLLYLLNELKIRLNIKIVVAHVHHNLRKESDEEAKEVEKYCKNNSLIFEMYKINEYPNGKFSEEKARKIRYDFFEKILKKYESDILFTAHHGDDLIETVLMRITRGSTLKGYAGFECISQRKGYIIARPLIFLTKSEIIDFLNNKGVWYANDLSNNSDKYTRNRYRNHILPELKKENINIHKKFYEYSKLIISADNYIAHQAQKIYEDIVINDKVVVNKFNELDYVVKVRILEYYFERIYKTNIPKINNNHINIIIDHLLNSNNIVLDLPLEMIGILEYNTFKIENKNKNAYYEYIFNECVILEDESKIEIDNKTNLSNNFVIHLNSDEIKFPFHVRNKRPNDRMKIKNLNGSKSVSDIFTDFKLPKNKRNSYPIVTDDNNEIIWIPGIKKSYLDRKKEGKYDIILKYSLKEEYNGQKTS